MGVLLVGDGLASMKAPPKRKGKNNPAVREIVFIGASMKAPPKRKGKRFGGRRVSIFAACLNESPSEKEGKICAQCIASGDFVHASMKAPPKRKGKPVMLKDSPVSTLASMKAPPKRKGKDEAVAFDAWVKEAPQ